MDANDLPEATAQRDRIVKITLVGDDSKSNALGDTDPNTASSDALFKTHGVIEPPYPPESLIRLFEHSNALRQNVDAYATNIDGFGHRFEPVIDFDSADAHARLAQAMYLERQRAMATPGAQPDGVGIPTDEEIEAKKAELVLAMRMEKAALEHFFDNATEDQSFVSMRRKLRQDLEVQGNGYLEVLRNGAGEIAEFVYLPAFTMRLTPLDREPTTVPARKKVSDIAFEVVHKRKHLRRYVQVLEGRAVVFKEFGDRRVVSSKSGKPYPTVEALQLAEEGAHPATEVVHFKVHSPRSAYGIPRWIGALLAVLGSRQAEEVNYLYFENKSIPPMALLVNGGRLREESINRLRDYMENEIKGKKNFHKMLILEADYSGHAAGSGEGSGRMSIDLRPLTDAQQKDALFKDYDERNMDKVGMAFRLPRLLRGDIRDFNRASAEAALDFAEQQVFQPEREEFDFIMNRKVLPELGVRFWRFESNAPAVKDPAQLSAMIKDLVGVGVLTPEEGRELAQGVFNKELAKVDAPWVKQPLALTLAGVQAVADVDGPWTGEEPGIGQRHGAFGDALTQLKVTPSAVAATTTINEIRASQGLGPRMLANGQPDPDGDLTVAEFQARRAQGAVGVLSPPAALKGIAPYLAKRGGWAGVTLRKLVALREALVQHEQDSALAQFMSDVGRELEAGERGE